MGSDYLNAPTAQEVLALLLGAGSLSFEPANWAYHRRYEDAPPGPCYMNIRECPRGSLSLEMLLAIGRHLASANSEALCGHLKEQRIKHIVAIPSAGLPLGEGFCQFFGQYGTELVKIPLQKKLDDQFSIEGPLDICTGTRLALVDDVASTVFTKLKVVRLLKGLGFDPVACVVYLDYGLGGARLLQEEGVKLHASITFQRMMQYCTDNGLVSEAVAEQTWARHAALEAHLRQQFG
jgi:orotate phosphoribosyltransferase